ncbi:hypothetical protein OS493_021081 [Desmophyllum pertusum]|uniref:SEA domain-containing protein n=1 Tax=Desmophyllum pertusum TaxID=174260 RepID=A0A9X0A136_9CNID|nr:hypothetical protein OS493_021081 [Desmophyllum pertusum]
MDPIRLCAILAVILGATSFIASQTPANTPEEVSQEFTGSWKIDDQWDSDYANSSTPKYKKLARDLKNYLTEVLQEIISRRFS